MATLAEIRQQYPQYEDIDDQQLADKLYQKFYSDMPREQFDQKVGFQAGPPVNVGEDMAKAGASGLARGTMDTVGMPGNVQQLMELGLRKGYEWTTGDAPNPESGSAVERFFAGPSDKVKASLYNEGRNFFSGQHARDVASDLTGGATEYKAKTTAGKYTGSVAEFVPGAAAFGGASVGNLLRFGALPGVASEAAGQATEGTAYEPYARLVASLLAPGAPALVSKLATPFKTSPERLAMADTLKKEGVDITAGQKTGSEKLRYMESELGGMAGQRAMEKQGEQFTRAALKRAGINADRALPEVMEQGLTRIGKDFDDLAARNTVRADPKIATDIRAIRDDYQLTANPLQRQVLDQVLQDVVTQFQKHKGTLPGEVYKTMRTRIDKAARNAKGNDNELAHAYSELRESLDELMERGIARSNPSDLGAWRKARTEYRNYLVVEEAAAGTGDNAAMGILSPSKLRQATLQKHGKRNYVRGKGDFAELSRAGEAIMKALPQSGTAPRTWARNLGTAFPALMGGLAGNTALPGLGMFLGGALGAGVPTVIGRAMLSGPGRKYLGNQAVSPQALLDRRLAGVAATGLLGGPR